MFKKILLAATPQIGIGTAPRAAFDLVRRHGADLVLYHALPICGDPWSSFEDVVPTEQLVESARRKIAELYADDLKDIPGHTIRVVAGGAHEQLLKIIHTEGVDLVVMGHHRSAMVRPDRMWGVVDTTIRKVCSNVFCPVMVVTDEGPRVADVKRIVMATDFSTPSDSALCYAIQVARTYDAHLDIFHVMDIGQNCPNPEYYMQDMNVFIDRIKERMERRYGKGLESISHSFECWEGVPYAEIIKHARWSDADLVIMAQYSSSEELAKSFIGSTVIQVALSPGCPSLIVNYRARVCM
ncbi:MAG: universal stress protein [Pseudomonadota bacterium]